MDSGKLQEAVALIRSGHKEQAREMLLRILKDDPRNEKAWMWLLECLPSNDQRIATLEQCLRFNPQSQIAQRAMAVLRSHPAVTEAGAAASAAASAAATTTEPTDEIKLAAANVEPSPEVSAGSVDSHSASAELPVSEQPAQPVTASVPAVETETVQLSAVPSDQPEKEALAQPVETQATPQQEQLSPPVQQIEYVMPEKEEVTVAVKPGGTEKPKKQEGMSMGLTIVLAVVLVLIVIVILVGLVLRGLG